MTAPVEALRFQQPERSASGWRSGETLRSGICVGKGSASFAPNDCSGRSASPRMSWGRWIEARRAGGSNQTKRFPVARLPGRAARRGNDPRGNASFRNLRGGGERFICSQRPPNHQGCQSEALHGSAPAPGESASGLASGKPQCSPAVRPAEALSLGQGHWGQWVLAFEKKGSASIPAAERSASGRAGAFDRAALRPDKRFTPARRRLFFRCRRKRFGRPAVKF